MVDIFVSYTSSDREWAHWIALELEKLGHVAHVHEWEIEGSESIYAWMEKRHDAADRVLCVVSDEYLKAPYSILERHAALWQAATKRPGFVLLVAVRPCKFPTLSDHLRRCELFGVPEDVARLRFRQFVEAPVKPESVPFPGKVLAVSNIPIRVPDHFLGRDGALAEIDGALKRGEGRVAITTLHGMRGVGKTVLAAAYPERHRADYRATWWIRAETPEPRGERLLQGRRNRLCAAVRVALEQKSRHLLDEQRHAARSLPHSIDHLVGERVPARDLADHAAHLRAVERRERNDAVVRAHGPGRSEFRPRGGDDQQRGLRAALRERAQEIERGRIGPVQILEGVPPTGAHRRATTACVFSVPAHRARLAASAVTRP